MLVGIRRSIFIIDDQGVGTVRETLLKKKNCSDVIFIFAQLVLYSSTYVMQHSNPITAHVFNAKRSMKLISCPFIFLSISFANFFCKIQISHLSKRTVYILYCNRLFLFLLYLPPSGLLFVIVIVNI